MSCEAHMCKVVELSLCANFLNTDPYTRVLKRWLVYAGCDCLTMFRNKKRSLSHCYAG